MFLQVHVIYVCLSHMNNLYGLKQEKYICAFFLFLFVLREMGGGEKQRKSGLLAASHMLTVARAGSGVVNTAQVSLVDDRMPVPWAAAAAWGSAWAGALGAVTEAGDQTQTIFTARLKS